MSPPPVFLSATSRDLGSSRALVASYLRKLRLVAVEQPDLPPDAVGVQQMLRREIGNCGSVVHAAGLVYGSETKGASDPRRSHTQSKRAGRGRPSPK